LNSFEEESSIRINQHLEKINRKAQQDSIRLISKVKADGVKRILKRKAELMAEFHANLLATLKEIVSGEGYKEFLKNNLSMAKSRISQGDQVRIYARQEDQAFFNDDHYELTYSENIIGGFRMIVNEEISYDYTLEGRLSEMSERINSILENIMEDNLGENNDQDE
jgi:vacuolar-type H+-ATPase subunit E/Vma4